MGKIKDFWNKPIEKSSFCLFFGALVFSVCVCAYFWAESHIRIKDIYYGTVSQRGYLFVDDGVHPKEVLYEVHGFANSNITAKAGDTVTIVNFYYGVSDDFTCYLGKPTEEQMIVDELNAVEKLFLIGGGFYFAVFGVLYIICLLDRHRK